MEEDKERQLAFTLCQMSVIARKGDPTLTPPDTGSTPVILMKTIGLQPRRNKNVLQKWQLRSVRPPPQAERRGREVCVYRRIGHRLAGRGRVPHPRRAHGRPP